MNMRSLTFLYWAVAICWNNYEEAVSRRMTTEKAISILNVVIKYSTRNRVLHSKAVLLQYAIVHHQTSLEAVESQN